MKVKEVFEKSVHFLRERKIESPRLETELLLASVLKTDRIGIYLKFEAPLSEPEVIKLRELVVRKSKGEPTAYLLGEKYFFNRRFLVGPGVLIPRPETEQIIEDILSSLKSLDAIDPLKSEALRIADLGAGSGCLGLTLGLEIERSSEIQLSQVTFIERSPQASQYCQKNLDSLVEAPEPGRYFLVNMDVMDWVPAEKYHIVVANPPYIDPKDPEVSLEVKAFEPPEALFADQSGLGDIKNWLLKLENVLHSGGFVYFEIGYKQGHAVRNLFIETGIFKSVEILQDFNKRDRIIKAVKNG